MAQVLIIDDSRLAAKVVQQMLAVRKIDVPHIKSIAEVFGLRGQPCLLRELKPDAILLDIMMPEMDGLEVLRKLKSRTDVKNVPVIMLSASTNIHNIRESKNLGAAGFLAKPVKSDRLYEELLRVAGLTNNQNLIRPLTGDMGSDRISQQQKKELVFGPIDLNYLMEIMDEDLEMVHDLIVSFLEHTPDYLAELRQAVAQGNGDALQKCAHLLKGSVGNFGAPLVTDTAQDLEEMGANNNLEKAGDVFEILETDINSVCDALQDWLVKNPI